MTDATTETIILLERKVKSLEESLKECSASLEKMRRREKERARPIYSKAGCKFSEWEFNITAFMSPIDAAEQAFNTFLEVFEEEAVCFFSSFGKDKPCLHISFCEGFVVDVALEDILAEPSKEDLEAFRHILDNAGERV